MSRYTVWGGTAPWVLDPPQQWGDEVTIVCPSLISDETGKPTWARVSRTALHPYTATARVTDPVTSHMAAAAQTPEKLRDAHHAVLQALRAGPLTDFALAEACSLSMGKPMIATSVGKRRGELVTIGLVRDSGRKGTSATGSPAILWALTNAGRAEVAA